MSRSAIYTANSTTQSVANNGNINLGTIIRRFGCNVNLSGNAINIAGAGYYSLDSSFTVAPTVAGNITITAYKDGVAIPGAFASSSVTTAGNPTNLSVTCLLRENCACCDDSSNITFVLTGTGVPANITNASVVVEKL